MNASQLFQISNVLVLPFWLLMLLAPRWRVTQRVASSLWMCAAPAALYVVLVLPQVLQILPALANPSATNVAALLGTSDGATIAWLHFLAFDLFVGRHVFLDQQSRGISAWVTGPVLAFVLMLGPIGFLLHLAVISLHRNAAPGAR